MGWANRVCVDNIKVNTILSISEYILVDVVVVCNIHIDLQSIAIENGFNQLKRINICLFNNTTHLCNSRLKL